MNYPRFMLPVVFMSLCAVSFAQTDAQKSFDKLKTLAGFWEGRVTTVPPQPDIEGKLMTTSLRVTSMGNAIVHEMKGAGRPDDPITMLYLDGDRLLLTHYCDAGIRFPRCGRQHAVRTHASCGVHRGRREPSHRGLDLYGTRGQAGPRTL